VHLSAAAVEPDVTSSPERRYRPEGPLAGGIEVIGPGRLAAALGVD